MKNIKLNDKVTVSLEKLIESRLLVQANSGGGKSWAIRRIIEQAFGHVQIIVIDPEGEFGNMRSRFDFVYVGKGGDAPAESRSAVLLAQRLLELKASAVIDLYELPPQERKHFVKLFCESLVNAPKELWHDCLVIIDEAHVFAPEKDQSEALTAVIDLASRGRKRGFCAVLATQRPAKLNKDAAAECNNKFIGRASLDIDRKRSAEELGFTTKEQVLSLRDLDPGEFYVFGPAISRDVEKITIGDVAVKPPKRGVAKQSAPAPSDAVKKLLAKLADLPQEAEQEARTVAELKQSLLESQRRVRDLERAPKNGADPKAVKKAVDNARAYMQKEFDGFKKKLYQELLHTHGDMKRVLDKFEKVIGDTEIITITTKAAPIRFINGGAFETPRIKPTSDSVPLNLVLHDPGFAERSASRFQVPSDTDTKMGAGERQVLVAIAQQPDGMTREHITVQTGYKRSTRDTYIQRLQTKGYVIVSDRARITQEGMDVLGSDYAPLPTGSELLEYHLNKLPQGEAKVLRALHETTDVLTRDEITDITGFKRSTRDTYIQRLSTRQLVTTEGGMVRISRHLI